MSGIAPSEVPVAPVDDRDDLISQLRSSSRKRRPSRLPPPAPSVRKRCEELSTTKICWQLEAENRQQAQVLLSSWEEQGPIDGPAMQASNMDKEDQKIEEVADESSTSDSESSDSVEEMDDYKLQEALRKAMKHQVILDESTLGKAQSVVRRILQAWVWPQMASLAKAVGDMERLTISVELLRRTGLGYVVSTKDIWKNEPERTQRRVRALRNQWKAVVLKMPSQGGGRNPLGDLKGVNFREKVEELNNFIYQIMDSEYVTQIDTRQAALALIAEGVRCWQEFAAMLPEEIEAVDLRSTARTVLVVAHSRAAHKYVLWQREQLRSTARAEAMVAEQGAPANAAEQAEKLSVQELERAHESFQEQVQEMHLQGLQETMKPRQAMGALAQAAKEGNDVTSLLMKRAETLALEGRRHSLASTRSALICWHAFSTHVLMNEECASLPPKSQDSMMQWLCTFRCWGTAMNYACAVKWICTHLAMDTSWWGPQLVQFTKGARKWHARKLAGTIERKSLMTDAKIAMLVEFFDRVEQQEMATLVKFCYEFLARCQSEAFPLQSGAPSDAYGLAPDRHSGVWVDEQATLHVRWQRRKNRPQGSWLRRHCVCKQHTARHCVAHRVAQLLTTPGRQVFSVKQQEALRRIQRALRMCGIKDAQNHKWKSFRAGKATAMAAAGCNLGMVLSAGEWSSAAYLRYVSEEAADNSQLLAMAIGESDSEAEGDVGTRCKAAALGEEGSTSG